MALTLGRASIGAMDMGTWTCHVCGEERPDAKISVRKHTHPIEDSVATMGCNVRYCNDQPQCVATSLTFCHVGKPVEP